MQHGLVQHTLLCKHTIHPCAVHSCASHTCAAHSPVQYSLLCSTHSHAVHTCVQHTLLCNTYSCAAHKHLWASWESLPYLCVMISKWSSGILLAPFNPQNRFFPPASFFKVSFRMCSDVWKMAAPRLAFYKRKCHTSCLEHLIIKVKLQAQTLRIMLPEQHVSYAPCH